MILAQILDKMKMTSYEKEIVIYLASVDSADAKTVYKNTRVPKGRIYSVLQDLQMKGFVEVIPVTPKKYEIKDIKKALESYLKSRIASTEEEIHNLKRLEVKPKQFNIEKKDPSVHILTGRDEHLRAIISMRENAKKEMLQIAPLFIGTFASNLSLRKAIQKGVSVRIIIPRLTAANRKNVKDCLSIGGQVKQLDSSDLLSLIIRDSSEFLIGVQDYTNSEERVVLMSKNKALLKTFQNTFDELWAQAEKINI